MEISINQSVGEGGVNKPNDVVQIDVLLRQVGMLEGISPTEQTRAEAIKRFQGIWNFTPDGKVDPKGKTLHALNVTAHPLNLKTITLKSIASGGYSISYTPKAPPKPYEVWLGHFALAHDYLDVSDCKNTDVITSANLPDLLALIKQHGTWGTTLDLRLHVALDGEVISESTWQRMDCPVQPHNGVMLPLDEVNNGDKLTYQGDSAKGPFYGRMFHEIDGVDGYFFKYAGLFETNKSRRGFDCITYVGTTCGGSTSHMADTADMVGQLGAKTCTLEKPAAPGAKGKAASPTKSDLEATDPQNVKDFFVGKTTGYYVMWSGGHVVLVVDGSVHEFAFSKQGYASTDVATWLSPYQHEKLSVRELKSKPALAT